MISVIRRRKRKSDFQNLEGPGSFRISRYVCFISSLAQKPGTRYSKGVFHDILLQT